MTRDPYAKALRVKPQQVIGDKRDKSLRQIWDEEIERGLTDDDRDLLAKLP